MRLFSKYRYMLTVARSRDENGRWPSDALALDVVDGLLPEVYDPVCTALRPLMTEPATLATLAAVAQEAIVVPSDLDTLVSSDLTGSRGDRFLATFVEYADQCGLLARLMAVAAECAPTDERVARVRTLVERIEAVLKASDGDHARTSTAS